MTSYMRKLPDCLQLHTPWCHMIICVMYVRIYWPHSQAIPLRINTSTLPDFISCELKGQKSAPSGEFGKEAMYNNP